MGHVGVGVVTGLHAEAALVGKHAGPLDWKPEIACLGPGAAAAREAAKSLVDRRVSGLVSFGFAGGIDENIEAGTIVLASEIRSGRQGSLPTNDQWRRALYKTICDDVSVIEAPLAAVDEIVAKTSEKTRLRYKTGAVAIDMESLAVGETALAAGVPFIAIRAISDPALQTLPIMAADAVDHNGKLKPWRIFWSLIRQPGQLGELRRLAANTRAATNSLDMVCRKTLPDFYLPKARGNTIRQLREAGDLHS